MLAHELGHHSSNHIPEAVAWFGLFALPGALILMLATRRRGGMGEPRGRPARAARRRRSFQLALAPAQNIVSRQAESEADWKALQTTREPAGRARALPRVRGDVARRPEPADVGVRPAPDATPRWRSASRWRTRGRAAARAAAR